MMDEKEKNRGIAQLVLNIVSIVVEMTIICMGVAAWLSESKRRFLLPCIFSFAALMCVLHMADLIRNMPRGKKNWNGVLITMAGVPLMMVMAALTYVCLH